MKKTFSLTHPKHKPARWVEAIKHEVKKYLNRERRKPLPEGMDYWSFDCRFGASEDVAVEIFTSEIKDHIDAAVAQDLPEFYVEIMARACNHKPHASTESAEASD